MKENEKRELDEAELKNVSGGTIVGYKDSCEHFKQLGSIKYQCEPVCLHCNYFIRLIGKYDTGACTRESDKNFLQGFELV